MRNIYLAVFVSLALAAVAPLSAGAQPGGGVASGSVSADNPQAVLKAARAAEQTGDWAAAEKLLADFAADPANFGADMLAGDCLRELMICRMHLADHHGAMEAGGMASDFFRAHAEHARAAQVMATLGGLMRAAGQPDRAARAYTSALASFTEINDRPGMASIHLLLGILAELRGELDSALGHFDEALALFRALGDEENVAQCHRNRAYALLHLGRFDDALSACQQALYIYNQLGLEGLAATTHCEAAVAYYELGDFRAALSECELGLAYWDTLPGSADMVACQKWRGLALAELDRPDEAYVALNESWDLLELSGQPEELAELLPALESVLKALGRGKEVELYRVRLRTARAASTGAGTPADY